MSFLLDKKYNLAILSQNTKKFINKEREGHARRKVGLSGGSGLWCSFEHPRPAYARGSGVLFWIHNPDNRHCY